MIRWVLFSFGFCIFSTIFAQGANYRNRIFAGANGAAQLALILNQNNYGFTELAYLPKVGFQVGPKIGYEWKIYNQVEIGIVWTTQGQSYRDNIANTVNEKEVALQYVYIPIIYRRILGYHDQWSSNFKSGNFYAAIGLQPGRLINADVTWARGGQDQSMFSFILDQRNMSEEEILALGEPSSDLELFKRFDIMGLLNFGYQYWISKYSTVSIELRNGLGLTDINDKMWRFPNRKNIYEPSRNAFLALSFSFHIYF